MKLLLVPALLLATVAGPAAIRFESDGVRVGSDFVTGAAINLKESGSLPLLVSGSVVESLSGESLGIAIGDKQLVLGAGLRLARTAEGFQLSTHGMPFTVEAAGLSLSAERSAAFKITDKGVDFGALGALEGTTFAVRVAAAEAPVVAAVEQQDDSRVSPEKSMRNGRRKTWRRLYSYDPLASGNAAGSIAVRQIPRVTPDGAP